MWTAAAGDAGCLDFGLAGLLQGPGGDSIPAATTGTAGIRPRGNVRSLPVTDILQGEDLADCRPPSAAAWTHFGPPVLAPRGCPGSLCQSPVPLLPLPPGIPPGRRPPMPLAGLVIEKTPPDSRRCACEGPRERHLHEAAVMRTATRWLFNAGAPTARMTDCTGDRGCGGKAVTKCEHCGCLSGFFAVYITKGATQWPPLVAGPIGLRSGHWLPPSNPPPSLTRAQPLPPMNRK